jgi:hypothetical protein
MKAVAPTQNYKMSKQMKVLLSSLHGEKRTNFKKMVIEAENSKVDFSKKKKKETKSE